MKNGEVYYDQKLLPDGRTLLRAFLGREQIWRIAKTPDQIAKKMKLLERDVELWKKGIRPQ